MYHSFLVVIKHKNYKFMAMTKLRRLKLLSTNWFCIFLIIIIILGVIIRCINIDNRVYWGDEIVTSLRISGYSYAEGIQNLTNKSTLSISDLMVYQQPNSIKNLAATIQGLIAEEPQHVPIYFVLARLWIQQFYDFGNAIIAIRSFSIFANLLSFVCLYWLCLELFGSRYVGLIAVALVAVSPFHLVYAQEARPPALWMFGIILSSALFLRAIRFNTKLSWIAYAISVVLNLYTFLFSILVFVSHGIYVFSMQRFRLTKIAIAYLISLLLGGLVFMPWLLVVASKLKEINQATGWSFTKIGTLNLFRIVTNNLRDLIFSIGEGYSYLTFFLLILIGYSLYFLWVKAPKSVSIFVFSLIGFTIVIILLPDLINGGTSRSAASRYFVAPYLGIHLSLAYLFYRSINSLSEWLRISWQVIITLLMILGLESCIAISQSELSFNQATYRNAAALARTINKYEHPLIIANSKYSNNFIGLIGLSYRLKSDAKFLLVDDTYQKIIPESLQSIFIYGGDSDSLLKRTEYEPQLILDDRSNQCCS